MEHRRRRGEGDDQQADVLDQIEAAAEKAPDAVEGVRLYVHGE